MAAVGAKITEMTASKWLKISQNMVFTDIEADFTILVPLPCLLPRALYYLYSIDHLKIRSAI